MRSICTSTAVVVLLGYPFLVAHDLKFILNCRNGVEPRCSAKYSISGFDHAALPFFSIDSLALHVLVQQSRFVLASNSLLQNAQFFIKIIR